MSVLKQDKGNIWNLLCTSNNIKPALVVGAGGAAFLPTSDDIKRSVIEALVEIADDSGASIDHALIETRIKDKRLTLELLFSLLSYRIEDKYFDPKEIWKNYVSVGHDQLPIASLQVACLRKHGKVGPILTTNFDQSIIYSFESLGVPYKLKTTLSIQNGGSDFQEITDDDIVILHGTLVKKEEATLDKLAKSYSENYESPETVVARKLARPFPSKTSKYLSDLFSSRDVYFFGYSGYDQYDMNLVIAESINMVPGRNGVGTCHWLSRRDKNPEGSFSPFVQSLVAENGTRHKIISCDLSSKLKEVDEFTGLENEAASLNRDDFITKDNLFRGAPLASVVNALKDLEFGVDRIWSAMEHYYLVSLGYSNDVVSKFSGLEEGLGSPLCQDSCRLPMLG